jgi:hypothetical protein
VNRPTWAPSWATEADLALLTEDPLCVVCARDTGLIRWLAYGLITCSKHSLADADAMTEKESDQLKDQDD